MASSSELRPESLAPTAKAAGYADLLGQALPPSAAGGAQSRSPLAIGASPATTFLAAGSNPPLLRVLALGSDTGRADPFRHQVALSLLRHEQQRPLLLVPAAAPPPHLPRRVAWAVDAELFRPTAPSRALAPLLASWPAEFSVIHVVAPGEQQAYRGQRALGHVRASKLLSAATQLALYEPVGVPPAAGILQAVDDLQADLLMLIGRPRSFLGELFHCSVTAQVLRYCRVPVLLLPAQAPDLPGWLPPLS